jgi:hypothetical protein
VDEQCFHYALIVCGLGKGNAHIITGVSDVCILKFVKAMLCV